MYIHLQFVIQIILNKCLDRSRSQFSEIGLEFNHVLGKIDETDSGYILLGQSKEFHDPCIILNVNIDVDEKNFSFEIFGSITE